MDVDIGSSTMVWVWTLAYRLCCDYEHGFIDTGVDMAPVYRHWCGYGHRFIDTGVNMDIGLLTLVWIWT